MPTLAQSSDCRCPQNGGSAKTDSRYYLLIDDIHKDQFVNTVYCGSEKGYLGAVAAGNVSALRGGGDVLAFYRLPDVRVEHRPADISLSHGLVPIVSARAAKVVSTVAPNDVELFRGVLPGEPEPLYLVSILKRGESYIDRARSRFGTYPNDPRLPPHVIGKISWIDRMVLDVEMTRNVHVLRPLPSHVCVSKELWSALEDAGATTGVNVRPTERLR